jgi:hypothetical protein
MVGVEYVQRIKDGFLDFDVMVATPTSWGRSASWGACWAPAA